MIYSTAGIRRNAASVCAVSGCELGEWESIKRAADWVLVTPARPKALIPDLSIGRGPGLMLSHSDGARRYPVNLGTSVYLYYDAHGTLIYVGITDRGIWRNREHDANAEWWRFVARQEVEHLATREAALLREKSLIVERQPPFNRQHNRNHEHLKAAYLACHAAGSAVVDPVELVRQLNKSLPLVVADVGFEDRFALKTLPEHSSIAHRLDDLAGLLVLGPRRVGRVVAQQNVGVHCFIMVELRRGQAQLEMGAAAAAPIRFAGGGRFRLAQIELTNSPGTPPGGAL